MCTDVDRNDKSRVSEPGTVKVIGRRLIESYAGVFHTVDHVEGFLKEGFDSLDAFLSHMWAVTVIGAPKKAAAATVESLERDARGWYGGAVGMISLNGDINTGILIRTTYLRDGMARYPVGATLLYDSVPGDGGARDAAQGHRLLPHAGRGPSRAAAPAVAEREAVGAGAKLLLVDNDDCFIHTLANYARQTGAEVVTYRAGFPPELIARGGAQPDSDLAGSGPSGGFRRARTGAHGGAAGRAGVRRLPGVAGDRGGVRRRAGRAGLSHARQAFHGAASRPGHLRRTARGVSGGPLPFALRAPRNLSGLPGSDGRIRPTA